MPSFLWCAWHDQRNRVGARLSAYRLSRPSIDGAPWTECDCARRTIAQTGVSHDSRSAESASTLRHRSRPPSDSMLAPGARYSPTWAGHSKGHTQRGSAPYQIAEPPETKIVSPVIQRASSEARKATGRAMSSGCPARPRGVRAIASLSKSPPAKPAA